MQSEYRIFAYWGPRPATPAACVAPTLAMFRALGEIDPALQTWWTADPRDEHLEALPLSSLSSNELATLIAHGANYSELDDQPMHEFGYQYYGLTHQTRDPRLVVLRGQVGGNLGAHTFANSINIETRPLEPANEGIINIHVFKPALLALARIWNASWCDAAPLDLFNMLPQDKTRRVPRFRGGWLTYLAAPFAAKVTPPRSAAIERFPDGSLLMMATAETFRLDNPTHVSVAREIDAALAPLNALPWPPDGMSSSNGGATRT